MKKAILALLLIVLFILIFANLLRPKTPGQVIVNDLYSEKNNTKPKIKNSSESIPKLNMKSLKETTTSTTINEIGTTTTTTKTNAKKAPYIMSLDLENEILVINGSEDIRNWTIEDESSHVYTFGILLEGPVKLHTFNGVDNKTDIFWNTSNVWNNNGDTAYLKNKKGDLIDVFNCSYNKCPKQNTGLNYSTPTTVTTTSTTTTVKKESKLYLTKLKITGIENNTVVINKTEMKINLTASKPVKNWVSLRIYNYNNQSNRKFLYPRSSDGKKGLVKVWKGDLSYGKLSTGLYFLQVKMKDYNDKTYINNITFFNVTK